MRLLMVMISYSYGKTYLKHFLHIKLNDKREVFASNINEKQDFPFCFKRKFQNFNTK